RLDKLVSNGCFPRPGECHFPDGISLQVAPTRVGGRREWIDHNLRCPVADVPARSISRSAMSSILGWTRNDGLATRRRSLWRGGNGRASYEALLALGAAIELVRPAAWLPDLVFRANAGVVLGRQVLLARFRHAGRAML